MLSIITGLPGAGKTLNTIAEIDQEHGTKRPIYYHGIRDLQLDHWTELEKPEEWPSCPEGSIIVIDEAQGPWPARGNKGEKPEAVSAVETHRHHGFDLYFITQDAKLLDHNLRRLAGRHVHWWRPFGLKKSTRWEWQRCVNPDDHFARKEAISKKMVKLPSKYFNAYHSAEVHTVKRRLPKKLLIFPALALLLLLCGFGGWSVLSAMSEPEPQPTTVSNKPAAADPQPVENAGSRDESGVIVGVIATANHTGRVIIKDRKGRQRLLHQSACDRDKFGDLQCWYRGRLYTQAGWITPNRLPTEPTEGNSTESTESLIMGTPKA